MKNNPKDYANFGGANKVHYGRGALKWRIELS